MANEAPSTEKKQDAGGSVKNCAACNKPLKKAKRYYRNGKYYCNKKCAKSSGTAPVSPEAKEAAPPAEQAKEDKAKEAKA